MTDTIKLNKNGLKTVKLAKERKALKQAEIDIENLEMYIELNGQDKNVLYLLRLAKACKKTAIYNIKVLCSQKSMEDIKKELIDKVTANRLQTDSIKGISGIRDDVKRELFVYGLDSYVLEKTIVMAVYKKLAAIGYFHNKTGVY